jgi:hypothetical protein
MPITFSEQPVSATWKGRIYSGTFREDGARLYVSSAYGSMDVPKRKANKGLKEAARLVLGDIIKARGL